jgi:hypothetical protein
MTSRVCCGMPKGFASSKKSLALKCIAFRICDYTPQMKMGVLGITLKRTGLVATNTNNMLVIVKRLDIDTY